MPGDGVFPLSTSFDAAGPMGHSVDCCAILDSIMTGGSGAAEPAFPASGLRLAVPRGYLFLWVEAKMGSPVQYGVPYQDRCQQM